MSRVVWNDCFDKIKQTGLDYTLKQWDFTSDEDITEFAATVSDSGTLTVVDTLNGGVAKLLTKVSTDNNYVNVAGDASYITLDLGRKFLFWARIAQSDLTENDWFAGVFGIDTELVTAWADGICFRKDDGDTQVDCVVHGNSVESVLAGAGSALTADTFTNLLFYVEMDPVTAAKGKVTFYQDGTKIGQIESSVFPLVSIVMTPEFTLQNGESTATAKYLLIDSLKLCFTV